MSNHHINDYDHYFDHDADIGIIGKGETLEASFSDAALAMFNLMADLKKVKPNKTITFEFQEEDNEFAFVTWLNRLIAEAQSQNLIFSQFNLKHVQTKWLCTASGVIWNDSIERGIEVKGATLTMLQVKKINGLWDARCVVDV